MKRQRVPRATGPVGAVRGRAAVRRAAGVVGGRERGGVLISFAIFLLVMLAFIALGVEGGRWYLVRAELSKSVDAGALAGARNISNPNVDPAAIAREFAAENFPGGYLGTPAAGTGAAAFDARIDEANRVRVDGRTNAIAILSGLVGFREIPVATVGAARKSAVEIMLVLDRSGSMSGAPISDLKTAANSFVDFFSATQAEDKMGLVSFATSVTVQHPLSKNFVAPIRAQIAAMTAVGATNAEDALDQADGPSGFTDQSAVPTESRVPQYAIFFSDGRPTAFRGRFVHQNANVEAVACVTGNCEPWEIGNRVQTYRQLGRTDRESWLAIDPRNTGDGLFPNSQCGAGAVTTRWRIFDTEPVPGFAPDACGIPPATNLAAHVCDLATNMALIHAAELRAKGVTVYAIGLGAVNRRFLEEMAGGPANVFYTPDSSELQGLFQTVAQRIKLRLVL